jgi:hypothetical protein
MSDVDEDEDDDEDEVADEERRERVAAEFAELVRDRADATRTRLN